MGEVYKARDTAAAPRPIVSGRGSRGWFEAPEAMPRTSLGVVVDWFAELNSKVGTETLKK
ncbi:MAG TPA: hypothetical protein VGO79_11230 [Thermoanaerobaculia bacterium]